MSFALVFFFLFATLCIGSAWLLLLGKHLLYNAFALLLSLLGIAGLYALVGADFLAVSQIMIYVGGVLVLIMFAVMYTQQREGKPVSGFYGLWGGLAVASCLGFVLVRAILEAPLPSMPQPIEGSTTPGIGMLLMTEQLLPFEIAGLLLLAALLAATGIAISNEQEKQP